MRCASALSTNPIPARAIGEAVADLLNSGSIKPDFVVVTLTPAFSGASEDIAKVVQAALEPAGLLSVVSEAVLAAGNEVIGGPAVGLWAIWADASSEERVSGFPIGQPMHPHETIHDAIINEANLAILFVNEWSPLIDRVLCKLDTSPSKPCVCGGLLSTVLGSQALLNGAGASQDGFLLAIRSRCAESVIGFGSQPISALFDATSTVGTMLCEINDEPALEVAKATLRNLPSDQRERSSRDLAVGLVSASTGEIIDVIRVLGADSTTGSLALAKSISRGDRFEFHVLRQHGIPLGLDSTLSGERASGAFLFSTDSLTDAAEDRGIGDLGRLTELLGTSAFSGVQVVSIIGSPAKSAELVAAPFSAAILGRLHY